MTITINVPAVDTNCAPSQLSDPNIMTPSDDEPVVDIDGHVFWSAEVRAAKAICKDCWFKDQCARDGIDRNEETGVWGGLTRFEREQVRAQRVARRRREARRDAANDGQGALL